jgi:pimeloyl-ACP methyl ester carboxylesterase
MDSIAVDGRHTEPMRTLETLSAREDATVDAIIRRAFDIGMAHRNRLSREALAEFGRPYAGGEGRAALARFARALADVGRVAGERDLAALEIPVFLLWGEDDPFTPAESGDRLNDLIPRSSLALLPGCGHFLPEEAPQTVVPLVFEYLRGTYAGIAHVHEAGPTRIELGRRYRDAGVDPGG